MDAINKSIVSTSTNPSQVGRLAPKRVQLRRTKGWRKPADAVVVARPSKWGNPDRVGDPHPLTGEPMDAEEVVFRYRASGCGPVTHGDVRRELRGKDLACWCPLDSPCHGDVLLEVANG